VSRKRLIVNADDLGLAESVNRGIIETMETGIVTSASLMVNMCAHDDAMRRLAAARSRGLDVGIGLHFNIVSGTPLTSSGTLADRGSLRFLPLGRLALRAFARRINPADVKRELNAQLDKAQAMLTPLAMRVTHIDSHRHAHCMPGILDVVVMVAASHGIRHVRHPRESVRTLLGRPAPLIATGLLRLLLSDNDRLDDTAFAGFALMGSRTLDRDLPRLLERLPEGTSELMVHPGYDSPELAALDPYRAAREREVRVLTSPAIRRRLQELGMELTHFGATAGPA
jgi:predicted glycoside hydrolase/deacetylase ChbG (UPF0249 family)